MFARMGVDVIKVESLDGDESRRNGPMVRGQSAYWVQYNSGKKSLAIDLRSTQGKGVLRDLVKVSDIFLQNFRPGTIEAMGFGYDVLRELNPRIVMVNRVGLWTVRPLPGQGRIRPHRPGHRWPDVPHRLPR